MPAVTISPAARTRLDAIRRRVAITDYEWDQLVEGALLRAVERAVVTRVGNTVNSVLSVLCETGYPLPRSGETVLQVRLGPSPLALSRVDLVGEPETLARLQRALLQVEINLLRPPPTIEPETPVLPSPAAAPRRERVIDLNE